MIEKTILDYLNTELNDAVYLVAPETKPNRFVVFEKTGESEYNHIKTATIAIQSISKVSLYDAASLNELVKEKMAAITSISAIGSCKKQTDYNWTDTTTKEYRYQAVYDIVYY